MQHIQSDEKLILYLSVHRITFLSYFEKKKLLKKLDSYNTLALLSIDEISKIIHRDFERKVNWDGKENLRAAKTALYYCKILNIDIILNSDENYPFLLKQIPDPPFLLFCRGNASLLNSDNFISVVGTRKLTAQGKQKAHDFAYDAAKNGVNIVSGLAYGADGFAHKGVLDSYYDFCDDEQKVLNLGKTVAVIPSGIDDVVPYGHKQLACKIVNSGGCIISEYEPKADMANWHFVARNRIIAGLSMATVVVEAPVGSGSLITADFALEYGREVYLHKACFSEMALRVSDSTKRTLEMDFARGKVSKYKMGNSIQKFFDAGAPVINDFEDFCFVSKEEPGIRNGKLVQGELFE